MSCHWGLKCGIPSIVYVEIWLLSLSWVVHDAIEMEKVAIHREGVNWYIIYVKRSILASDSLGINYQIHLTFIITFQMF